jgi:hypothetical protein
MAISDTIKYGIDIGLVNPIRRSEHAHVHNIKISAGVDWRSFVRFPLRQTP